jgi:hypothetical protein
MGQNQIMNAMNKIELVRHLSIPEDNGPLSCFAIELWQARVDTGRDSRTGRQMDRSKRESLCGAVGYLSVLDYIGTCFRRSGEAEPSSLSSLTSALFHFASLITEPAVNALLALQNLNAIPDALSSPLSNLTLWDQKIPRYYFVSLPLNRILPLRLNPSDRKEPRRILLGEFGDLVEDCYQSMMELLEIDQLEIQSTGLSQRYFNRPFIPFILRQDPVN